MTIQPSILRTATAFVDVRASEPALGFVLSGDSAFSSDEEAVGGAASTSISVDIAGKEGVSLSAQDL